MVLNFKHYAAVACGAVFLLLPALYNGYPLLNPDVNTYLCSGFLLETPFDRPIMYGLLLRIMSLNGLSLFPAAFAQCWIMSWLLLKLTQRIGNRGTNNRPGLGIILLLSLTTSLSWTCCTISPDIYTPVTLLCLCLILLGKEVRFTEALLYLLFTLAVATHMSHIMIMMIVLSVAWCCRSWLFGKEGARIAARRMYVAAGLTLATIATMGSAMAKSKHVFFMGAMLEQGILKQYLDEHCATSNYRLCTYKDKLPPNAVSFLWASESPLYATGGWEANKEEYGDIINGTLTQPKYIWLHIKMSLLFSAKQCLLFGIGDGNEPFAPDRELHRTIARFLPGDIAFMDKAKQQRNELTGFVKGFNSLIYLVMVISLVLLALLSITGKSPWRVPVRILLFLSLVAILANTWNCATFSLLSGRYGCRMMWLIPFCACVGVLVGNKRQSASQK